MYYKQDNQAIVKELLFGEANRFAHEPFKSGSQGQVFTFQALHGGLTYLALLGGQTGFVGPPSIGEPPFHLPPGLG